MSVTEQEPILLRHSSATADGKAVISVPSQKPCAGNLPDVQGQSYSGKLRFPGFSWFPRSVTHWISEKKPAKVFHDADDYHGFVRLLQKAGSKPSPSSRTTMCGPFSATSNAIPSGPGSWAAPKSGWLVEVGCLANSAVAPLARSRPRGTPCGVGRIRRHTAYGSRVGCSAPKCGAWRPFWLGGMGGTDRGGAGAGIKPQPARPTAQPEEGPRERRAACGKRTLVESRGGAVD